MTTNPTVALRDALSHHEQMLDAQNDCVPCKLCGGKAVISDAGIGAGYYIRCDNSRHFRDYRGCMLDERRVSGWAYNVMDWWNRLHTTEALTPTQDSGGSGEVFRRARQRHSRVEEAILDPNAVHVNMLRGGIAKPSVAQIIHIYGENALLTALAPQGGSVELPDIGEVPDMNDGDGAETRLELAYQVQQKGVPDQAALVWRSDLMSLFHRYWRLQGIAGDGATPDTGGEHIAGAGEATAIAASADVIKLLDDPAIRDAIDDKGGGRGA